MNIKIEDDIDAEKYIHSIVKDDNANKIAILAYRLASGSNGNKKECVQTALSTARGFVGEPEDQLENPLFFCVKELPSIGTSLAVSAVMMLFNKRVISADNYLSETPVEEISREALDFSQAFCQTVLERAKCQK